MFTDEISFFCSILYIGVLMINDLKIGCNKNLQWYLSKARLDFQSKERKRKTETREQGAIAKRKIFWEDNIFWESKASNILRILRYGQANLNYLNI